MTKITGEERPNDVAELRRNSRHLLLERRALTRLIRRYESGDLTDTDLTEIANQLEARDDVDYEPGTERAIADVLFELAAPEINGDLNPARCAHLIRRLESSTA